MKKDQIINDILKTEGGYINDPDDSGGETNHGITKETAVQYGYVGDMKNLSRQTAFEIYEKLYWYAPGFDKISNELIAGELTDTGVNMGPKKAIKFLQRSLNSLNHKLLYADLTVDGRIGNRTIEALKINLLRANAETVILKMLNSLQGARYIKLSESRKKDRKFIFGWFSHRI